MLCYIILLISTTNARARYSNFCCVCGRSATALRRCCSSTRSRNYSTLLRRFTSSVSVCPSSSALVRVSRVSISRYKTSLSFSPLLFFLFFCSFTSNEEYQVAERALYLWSNDHVVSLVADSVDTILPIIYNVLFFNAYHHWNR